MSGKGIGIEELATFCRKKGFVYPSGEIYGGLGGFWDYGHLGVELVNNLKKEWWKFHVHQREDIEGIDGSIITNPKVWKASGHVGSFIDIIVKDKKTGKKSKIDAHEIEEVKKSGKYEIEGEFNPMFTTKVGPSGEGVEAYLRPETAQLIFSNFKFVQENARLKLPFGIAQIGKAFRNEISPREFLFRAREFEQMEIEYFISKGMKCPYIDEIKNIEIEILSENAQKKGQRGKRMKIYDAWKKGVIKTDWHAYWIALEYSWFILMGAEPKKFRARQHVREEKAHYAIDTWDLEYNFPMGWRELQGFANRGNFDLSQHQKESGKSMEIQDSNGKKVLPEVVCEPSLGVGRAFLVFLFDAYEYDKKRGNVVLHLSPKIAPYKVAVFPLVNKGEILEASKEIYKELKEEFNAFFDKSGSIGRRYARQDEIGTPFCVTVDGESLKDKRVTIRERDSTKQIRVSIKEINELLRKLINDNISFSEAGELVK